MEISSLTVSKDKTQLDLRLLSATNVVILRLWTNKTYKNYGELIDLSAKLNGASIQDIAITLDDIGEDYFDGIYFVEAEDSSEKSISYVGALTRYKECIMDRLSFLTICDDCNNKVENSVINTHMLLEALENAMEERFIDEILTISSSLDKMCSDECKTCGQYGNIIDTDDENVNYGSIKVKIDGGEL